jgi:hypothetical protein
VCRLGLVSGTQRSYLRGEPRLSLRLTLSSYCFSLCVQTHLDSRLTCVVMKECFLHLFDISIGLALSSMQRRWIYCKPDTTFHSLISPDLLRNGFVSSQLVVRSPSRAHSRFAASWFGDIADSLYLQSSHEGTFSVKKASSKVLCIEAVLYMFSSSIL